MVLRALHRPSHDHSRARRCASRLVALLGMVALIAGIGPGILAAAPAGAEDTDFNGDGRDDLFWYAPGSSTDYTWYGQSGGGFSSRAQSINGRYEPVSGDFNGDGRSDVFWYGVGSTPDYIWYGQSGGGFSSRSQSITGRYEPVSGDFNGDGESDVFWYGAGSTPDYIWYGQSGGGFSSRAQSITGLYEPVSGDFDGDGEGDIFWYGVGSTPDYIWYGQSGGGFSSRSQSITGRYQPVSGDFNGDDQGDIFWYGVGPTPDYIWYGLANGGFYSRSQSITGAYEPVTGDFDGDGESDIFWYGAGSTPDYIWYGLAGGGFSSRAQSINGRYQLLDQAPRARLAPVAPGDRGAAVLELQTRLRELNFFVPRLDGNYDAITQQAVMAFQGYHGLGRDGVAGSATIAKLATAGPAVARTSSNHVEVSIAKQTLTVVRDGRTLVFHTSTGRPGLDTPTGWYTIGRQINGLRITPVHAELWRPKYFNGGIAMHGYPSIPGYPASHGCTRLHDEAIDHIWDAGLAPLGTPVWVY